MRAVLCIVLFTTLSLIAAHMEMRDPPPFQSKYNPNSDRTDYSMTSPLHASGDDFPCKGHHKSFETVSGKPVATWNPGNSYQMKIVGGAAHGGGSCQASLSYDKGVSWRVIHSYIGDCPQQPDSTFSFTLPVDTPPGNAIFAWTWFNKIGNREMYMNCASVVIQPVQGQPKSIRDSLAFTTRPTIFVANIGNGCSTVEGKDLIFPNPGPDISVKSTNTDGPRGSCASVHQEQENPALVQRPIASSSSPDAQNQVQIGKSLSPSHTLTSSAASMSTGSGSMATGGDTTRSGLVPGSPCSPEGIWSCIGGSQFQRCASGVWSVMLRMAAGTSCVPGQSAELVTTPRLN